jgi:eukaryotic-like serine/threonine-protein kinase
MGIVYEAFDERLKHRIAIKCARMGYQNRLPPEARTARKIGHPNVCKVYDLHPAKTRMGEVDFLTMEFIEGETLAQRMKRSPLELGEAQEIARQICDGLEEAHREGVVHGDLKCANVILSRSTQGGVRAVITDFGLARMKLDDASGLGKSPHGGTRDYMAPELWLGASMSFASDIYALGVILHVMLAGKPPARVVTPLVTERISATVARPDQSTVTEFAIRESDWQIRLAPLPGPWDSVVKRSLASDPKKRFTSVREVKEALHPRWSLDDWLAAVAVGLMVVVGFTAWLRPQSGPPVRLAILPPLVKNGTLPLAPGIVTDIANRLSGVRANFVLITPKETPRDVLENPEKAKLTLSATHIMTIALQRNDEGIAADAKVIDTSSSHPLRELHGQYSDQGVSALGKALTATVTSAFGLRQGVPAESVSPQAYPDYVRGLAERDRGVAQSDAALAFFEKAAALDPRSALPLAAIGETEIMKFHADLGRVWLEKAGKAIARAQSLNAESIPVLLAAGAHQRANGSYEQAALSFLRATQLDPSNSEAWKNLANVEAAMNRPGDAIATYRKAIHAQPDYFAPYLDFGRYYYEKGQHQEAEVQYRQAIALAPQNPLGHTDLGLVLKERGRFDEAEKSFREAVRLDASSRSLSNLGTVFYSQGLYENARQFFLRSLAAGPPSAIRYANLGDACAALGRTQDALDAYRNGKTLAEEEVMQNPRRVMSRALLASIDAHLGETRAADFELRQALRLEPENARVKREAAVTYEFLKQRDQSLEVLKSAPFNVIEELDRHPALTDLRRDPRFQDLLAHKPVQPVQ